MEREIIRALVVMAIADSNKLTEAVDSIENAFKSVRLNAVDEFAKSAMQSYMAICTNMHVNGGYIAATEYENLAKYSYEIADAMSEEKKKRG